MYAGYFLGDAATQQAVLRATAQEAARTVHQPYLEDLWRLRNSRRHRDATGVVGHRHPAGGAGRTW
ncbi:MULTISPECIES: hypothetical protein [unclassified Kitasatospora]|uniref:hypothetical protein n=1 Tax=Kitasatospora sp. NPDC001603 TaxID=3154388 RepID=UPI00331846A1